MTQEQIEKAKIEAKELVDKFTPHFDTFYEWYKNCAKTCVNEKIKLLNVINNLTLDPILTTALENEIEYQQEVLEQIDLI